jgi:hypothetical protein
MLLRCSSSLLAASLELTPRGEEDPKGVHEVAVALPIVFLEGFDQLLERTQLWRIREPF